FVAVERQHFVRDRARGYERRAARARGLQRERRDARPAAQLGQRRIRRREAREQPAGDRVLDERHRRGRVTDAFGAQRHVEQARARRAHRGGVGGRELLPERGVEAQRLRRAHRRTRTFLGEQLAEQGLDRLLLLGEREIHGYAISSSGRWSSTRGWR